MSAPALEPDAVARFLARTGHPPQAVLDGPGATLFLGWQVELMDAELVFRLVDPESLLLIRYRRLADGQGLRSQFRAMVWLVESLIAAEAELGVKRMVGTIDTSLFRKDGGLDDNRLFRFYAHCGARLIDSDEMPGLSGIERRWYALTGARWASITFADYHRPGRRTLRAAS